MATSQKQRLEDRELREQTQEIGDEAIGPAAIASAASVGLSLYYFYVRGDRMRGLFVGLWPPTILAFSSYFNQRRMSNQLETITKPGSTLKDAVDAFVGERF